jgi:hypothetical protein
MDIRVCTACMSERRQSVLLLGICTNGMVALEIAPKKL